MTFKVIKYFGSTCAPCKAIAPIFDKVQKELEEEGFVFESRSIDEDTYRNEARTFGIRGIPTIVVFEDSVPVDMKTGMQSEDMLQNFILSAARKVENAS